MKWNKNNKISDLIKGHHQYFIRTFSCFAHTWQSSWVLSMIHSGTFRENDHFGRLFPEKS